MNNELVVLITRGLPASGKSTYARKWVALDPESRRLIEKDEIRKDSRLFKDGVYNHRRGDEAIVIRERDRLIREALKNGVSVITSDTNLVQKHINRITNIAKEYDAEVEVVDFLDVSLHDLIERDKNRENPVGEQVIRRMFHDHVKKLPTFLEVDPSLPWVVVCDMDGTLTNGPKNRSPFEWHKVGNDDINLGVAAILDGISVVGLYKIYIFSGRSDVCRAETEEWLERHDIEYDKLVMRPEGRVDENGNQVPDTVVKAEMIEEHIRGKCNVLFWLDDRPVVVKMLNDVYGINVLARGDQRHNF